MDTTDQIYGQQREEFKGNLDIIEQELIPKFLEKGEEPVSLDVVAMRKKMSSAIDKLRPSARAAKMLEEDRLREKAIENQEMPEDETAEAFCKRYGVKLNYMFL